MCGCSCSSTKAETRAADAAVFSVPDMSCGHCVSSITKAFAEKLPGVPVVVDLSTRTVSVDAPAELAKAIIADAGYEVTLA
ncbi:heavy-metal-associated domain-containing protein [Amaricoccus sp. W119]|jgi:copper chaperone|uniref:heavy-metal-associated domain-containing protein n=1 Tax=Amaricoccus sp. W119 TaxID=3391833 RepID=UPI0039A74792